MVVAFDRSMILCLGGDVMTGRGVDQILPRPSSPEIFEPWMSNAREYVELAEEVNGPIPRAVDFEYIWGDALAQMRDLAVDARIINLETSVTRDGTPWPGKFIQYRMHPDNVPCLTAARIDVAVLANNHVLDWGHAGLLETLETLGRAGITTVGAGRSRAEAEQPAMIEVKGGRALVIGRAEESSGVPRTWAATADRPGVALLSDLSDREADLIGDTIARTKLPGDVTVASLHWGPNWGYDVPHEYKRFAHALIERGVDIVHGHSSHHARPIEIHRGKLVLYGCGDLLNDYEGIQGYEPFRGDLVLLYFALVDEANGQLRELTMLPLRVRRMRLTRVSSADASWLVETLSRISRPFGTRVGLADDRLVVSVDRSE